jgi:hypothetical protein
MPPNRVDEVRNDDFGANVSHRTAMVHALGRVPAQPVPLVGRQAQLEALRTLLFQPEVRPTASLPGRSKWRRLSRVGAPAARAANRS